MSTWLIVGATSGIATPLARELASRGNRLFLAGRDNERLALLADDIRARFSVKVAVSLFSAADFDSHVAFVEQVESGFGRLDGVVWAVGILEDQSEVEKDLAAVRRIFDVNTIAAISLLHLVAERMEKRRRGCIVAISSVAGDRGRGKNYVYGAAKAALSTFLQGLRQRLEPSGVKVLTVKPGFVKTRMTEGEDHRFLMAEPDQVAADIARAVDRGAEVVYTPWYWRLIMIAIRHVPEVIFKRFKF